MMTSVLIVEDDPMVQKVNQAYIKKDGRFDSVITIGNGAEARTFLQHTPVDLILLDVYMPQLDGFSLLQALRQHQQATDVILVTAANDLKSLDKALKYGALDYLVKPFEYSRFEQALNRFFQKKKLAEGPRKKLSQQEIDRLFTSPGREAGNVKAAAQAEKGIQPQTLEKIRSYLTEHTGQKYSGGELSHIIGLSHVTVHKYLNYLESHEGLQSVIDYGTEGRPCIRYFY
jgi:response regulator of citrate/malate metabolism